MAAQQLDLSDNIPANATDVFLLFEIEPPTATVTVFGYAGGVFPTMLRGKGRVTVKLLHPQTLKIEPSANVAKHNISVSGYSVADD